MGIGKDGAVRRQLRTLFNVGAVRELTDGQLLERFATDRGEAAELAFARLVERHGPMVLRVCRGVLADAHDAQDAFQATFLVLVKRARGLWVRDSLGPWLHQVAYRTATCARATAARHRRLERRAAMSAEETRPERDFELERLLHEEIDRLPERFRRRSCSATWRAAPTSRPRGLGWPVGTVKSRLSRGRERLRDRLIRRGVAFGLGPLAVAGAFKVPAVSIPPALLDATTAAAVRFADARPGVARVGHHTCRGSPANHDDDPMVEGRHGPGRRRRDGLGGRMARRQGAVRELKHRPPSRTRSAPAAPTREVKRGKLTFVHHARGTVETARAEDLYCTSRAGRRSSSSSRKGRASRRGKSSPSWTRRRSRTRSVNQTNHDQPGARPTFKTPSSPVRSRRSRSRNTRTGSFQQEAAALDAGDRRIADRYPQDRGTADADPRGE